MLKIKLKLSMSHPFKKSQNGDVKEGILKGKNLFLPMECSNEPKMVKRMTLWIFRGREIYRAGSLLRNHVRKKDDYGFVRNYFSTIYAKT